MTEIAAQMLQSHDIEGKDDPACARESSINGKASDNIGIASTAVVLSNSHSSMKNASHGEDNTGEADDQICEPIEEPSPPGLFSWWTHQLSSLSISRIIG